MGLIDRARDIYFDRARERWKQEGFDADITDILDEAQNTTPAQMKMFLTRIGFGSKVVVTGDMTQKDLPRDTVSGLEVATKVLSKVEEIAFIKLTNKDVVRHPLVQKIVKAYEDYEENQAKAAKRREARKGSQTGRRKD